MLAALIPLAWLAWWCALAGRHQTLRLAEAGAVALSLVGVFAYLAPIALSHYDSFDAVALLGVWVAFTVASMMLGLYPRNHSILTGIRRLATAIARAGRAVRASGAAGIAWAASLTTLLALPLASALLYPPTVWDSLAYHLPVALQYVQNQTVAAFPTYYATMIDSYPGALYLLAQVYALGGEGAVNLIQWVALLVVAGTTYGIARELGAGRGGARLATLLAVASPTIILQASTSQHDLVVAAWVLVAAYLALRLVGGSAGSAGIAGIAGIAGATGIARPHPRPHQHPLLLTVGLGATLGTGFVTKPTFLVVVAPVALWALWKMWRTSDRSAALRLALVALTVALAVASPLLTQNLARSGSVLGTGAAGNAGLTVTDTGVDALWANLVRNFSLEFASPSGGLNRVVEAGAARIGGLLGGSVYAASNLSGPELRYGLTTTVTSPESTPAPVLALLGIAAVAFLAIRRDTQRTPALGFGIAAIVGWIALAAVLAYQPWAVRFYMAPLLLLAPVIGVAATVAARSNRALTRRAVWLLAAAAFTYGGAIACLHITQPLAPISLLTRGNLDSTGWWNTPYAGRALATSVPFMAPEVAVLSDYIRDRQARALELGIAGASDQLLVAYLGGTATDALPAYPLMSILANDGFALALQPDYGPATVSGFYHYLSDGTPAVIIGYDRGAASTILDSAQLRSRLRGTAPTLDPSADGTAGTAYRELWRRYVPELDATVTIFVLGEV